MTKKEIWQLEKVNWQQLRNFQDNEFVLFNPCIQQVEHRLVAQTHDSWWCHCTCIAAKLAVLSDRTTWSPDPLKDQNLGLAQFILIYFDDFWCRSASFVRDSSFSIATKTRTRRRSPCPWRQRGYHRRLLPLVIALDPGIHDGSPVSLFRLIWGVREVEIQLFKSKVQIHFESRWLRWSENDSTMISNGSRAWLISDHLRIPDLSVFLVGIGHVLQLRSERAPWLRLALSNAVSTSTSSKSKSFLYALVTLVTSTWVARSLQKIGWVRELPVSIVMWRYIGKNLKKA